jgi:hypothetical protein
MDKSGHGKKASERGALTTWRSQSDGQVRTSQESERARSTHVLESAERWTSEDTKKNERASKGYSLAGERRGDRQVRTRKESERAGGTHELESAKRRTSEDTERKQASEGHSHTGECRAIDK